MVSQATSSDGLPDLEFVAIRSGSSLVYMKAWPGKKGEATRCDFVVVVLGTNSPVPGKTF